MFGRTPKEQKVKQGHKLVWLTLIIIAIPCIVVGYVLLTSMEEQNNPVVGSRFSDADISPSITTTAIATLKQELSEISGVESVSVNLKSATLRINMDMNDNASEDELKTALDDAYTIVNNNLPIETYFTNSGDGKMYDLEINAYTFLVEDDEDASAQIYVKLTKTGRGEKVIDVMTTAKDPDLAASLKEEREQVDMEDEDTDEQTDDESYDESADYSYGY